MEEVDDNGIFDTGDGLADPEAVVEFLGLQNKMNIQENIPNRATCLILKFI